jgi:hypothetical protein
MLLRLRLVAVGSSKKRAVTAMTLGRHVERMVLAMLNVNNDRPFG